MAEPAEPARRAKEYSGTFPAEKVYEWYDSDLVLARVPEESVVGDTILVRTRDGETSDMPGYFGRGEIVSKLNATEAMLKPLEMFD